MIFNWQKVGESEICIIEIRGIQVRLEAGPKNEIISTGKAYEQKLSMAPIADKKKRLMGRVVRIARLYS